VDECPFNIPFKLKLGPVAAYAEPCPAPSPPAVSRQGCRSPHHLDKTVRLVIRITSPAPYRWPGASYLGWCSPCLSKKEAIN